MSKPDDFNLDEFELPGLEAAEKAAAEHADKVDDIYVEREGDNDCSSGACAI